MERIAEALMEANLNDHFQFYEAEGDLKEWALMGMVLGRYEKENY